MRHGRVALGERQVHASGGVHIDVADEAAGAFTEVGAPEQAAAVGGDDYELLFAIAPEARAAAEAAAQVSWLGDARLGSGVVLLDADGRPVEGLRGYEHK